MVFKSIERIKTALPEVIHIVMFYNNGTIFQTTFDQEINVPKLGENIAEVLEHVRKVYEFCNFKLDPYKKLIFETDNVSMIILKLGEDSNIALFFEKEEDKELRLTSIKRYLNRIEELIDTDIKELKLQEILNLEGEIKSLNSKLNEMNASKSHFEEELSSNIIEENKKDEILLNIAQINSEIEKISDQINHKEFELNELKKDIEGTKS
ncbi:MAG: hypothetical protein P8Y70_14300 [Candidatus Lokiarchaeota archaeon]